MLIQEKLTSLSTAQTSLFFHKMRAGSSTVVHQSLTPDASAIVKQAASLAHRRGHAQVTPFHVAVTTLSIPNGPFRSACIQSHSQSHPLRCRALDLCFNVALNRLPSSSQTLVGSHRSHHQSPSLSNALVAAFKRAQAHQRRGFEQQPMIAVRIGVEQLIMSILDDPSVSRVMKEAGFSSTRVKAFVEKAYPSPYPNTAEPTHGGTLRSEDVYTAISLELSLNHDSKTYSQLRSNGINEDHEIRNELAFSLHICPNTTSIKHNASALPPWLVQHKEESRRATTSDAVSLHVNDQKSTLISGSSSHNPNSSSSTEIIEADYLAKFKELNAENLKALCNSLEKVTRQKETIPNIASTVLQCRSGMMKRKDRSGSSDFNKEETWFLFLGSDAKNKEKIARELAAVIFGSHTDYISIRLGEFSSFSGRGSKRTRLEVSKGYLESFIHEIQENPHRVIVLEEVEKVDYSSQMGIMNAITSGTVRSSSGKDVGVRDAIIILSSESFDIKSITCCRPGKQRFNSGEEEGAAFNLKFHFECRAAGGSSDDFGFLEAVDRVIVFKCPDEL